MTKWEVVAQWSSLCGLCGTEIGLGMPRLVITYEKVKRPLYRCEGCAGPAPPDLPRDLVKPRLTKRMHSASDILKAELKRKPEWLPYRDTP